MPSGGKTKTNTAQQTFTSTQPWGPAIPAATGVLSQAQGMLPTAQLTGTENQALGQLSSNALNANTYAPQIGALTKDLFAGGQDYRPMVQGAYDTLQSQLSPYTSASFLDPYSNPATKGIIDTLSGDITNQIKGQFGAAGRLASGAYTNNLARGLSSGLAPTLFNQYNTNVGNQLGAISSLFQGGTSTANTLSGLQQQQLANRAAGIDAAQAELNAQNYGPTQQLAIEQLRRSIPTQQLGALSNIINPIAGLGGTTQGWGVGSSTSTQDMPLANQLIGGTLGLAGLLGGNAGLGSGFAKLGTGLGGFFGGLLGRPA